MTKVGNQSGLFLTSIIHFDTNLSFFLGGLKDIMWDASPSSSPQLTALLQVDGVLQFFPLFVLEPESSD